MRSESGESTHAKLKTSGFGFLSSISHNGPVCTGETYKSVVKMTFAEDASLPDPSGLFNSSLEGTTRHAIDFQVGDQMKRPCRR